jgi:hypothetical protein
MSTLPTDKFKVCRYPTPKPYETLRMIGLFFGAFMGIIILCESVFGNLMIAVVVLPFVMFYVIYKSQGSLVELEVTVNASGLTILTTKSGLSHEVGMVVTYTWTELKSFGGSYSSRWRSSGLTLYWNNSLDSFLFDKQWKKLLQFLRNHFPNKETQESKKIRIRDL